MRKDIILTKCERSAVRIQTVGETIAPCWSQGQMSMDCGKVMMSSCM